MTDQTRPITSKPDTGARLSPIGVPVSGRTSAPSTSGPQSLSASRSPSAVASPWSSRDSSPAPGRKHSSSISSRGLRSRKNSHEVSPSRSQQLPIPTTPSAASIQRALSAASIPSLQPSTVTEPSSRTSRPQRAGVPTAEGAPHWPVSPRLKSPPPSSSVRRSSKGSSRKPDLGVNIPSIASQTSANPTSSNDTMSGSQELRKEPEKAAQSSSKTTSRAGNGASKLETVQETSLPPTPAFATDSSQSESRFFGILSDDDISVKSPEKRQRPASTTSKQADSESDSGGRSRDRKSQDLQIDPDSTPRPTKIIVPKSSQSSLQHKSGVEPVSRNMTVETETVNSVAQAALGQPDRIASGRLEPGGTLRVKASTETIRPKKERKKAARKAPSINAGNASSRADIFEGQVLDAMDQASSDDSDETFVYESNPPEPQPHRSRSRHHSRTPSANSMGSTIDPRLGNRSLASVVDHQKPMQKSRSMKFANNAYNPGLDDDYDRQDGTVRANRNGTASVHHHHLAGRQNRIPTGHTSIIDDENPTFPQLHRPRSITGLAGRQSQNARLAAQNLRVANSNGKKNDGYSSYDMDDEQADDERTPLMGTVRSTRSNPRNQRNLRPRYPQTYPRHRRSFLSRFAGCVVLVVMLLLLAFGVIGFLFAISKPLMDVRIVEIKHVLASEQEIMLDLVVEAMNPNLLPITIEDMDVNVFAKSRHVGSEKWWREHGGGQNSTELVTTRRRRRTPTSQTPHATSAIDDLRDILDSDSPDPPATDDDSAGGKATMLLGYIYYFDSPLSFDGSFMRRHYHLSTGSVRLSHPGNKTEMGGTERWERVLQHDFELIIRGVLQYSIPLGGSMHTAAVGASILVHPESGDDGDDGGNLDGVGRVKQTQTSPVSPVRRSLGRWWRGRWG